MKLHAGALAVTAAIVALCPPVLAQPRAVAVRDVRVFDGERVIPAATVVFQNGRITAVGPRARVPAGAELIDGRGKTLLPGLIDAHTHTFAASSLESALAFGVTTQLDMFTAPAIAAGFRRQQEDGQAHGRADLRSSGILVTAPRGHGTQFGVPIPTIDSAAQAAAFVRERVAEGSEWIKIVIEDGSAYRMRFATIDDATLRAVIAAAHSSGKLAVVHVALLADARRALEAGADGLVHVWMDSVPDAELVREMARRRMFVVPTLSVVRSIGGGPSSTLPSDARVAPLLGQQELEALARSFPRNHGAVASYDAALASTRALHAGGVRVLAGTDAPNPGTAYGASMHGELELLVSAGMSPLQALRSATSATAAAFGLEDRGRIAPGLRADVVLVDGDPTADVTATRTVAGVWKEGHRFDRDAFARRLAQQAEAARTAASRPALTADGTLLSGFDDGQPGASMGAGWVITTDQMAGGSSEASMAVVQGGAGGTTHSLEISGNVESGQAPWAGAMIFPHATPMTPVNLSAVSGIRFHARGDGATYRVMLFTRAGGAVPRVRTLVAGPAWERHGFAWKDFDSDGSDVMGVAIVAGPAPGEFRIRIDQVELR